MTTKDVLALALDALEDTAQTLAWMQHGKCRGYSPRLLTTEDALSKAREAITAIKQAQEPVDKCVTWTTGPNEWKDWCAQWFGPDADDDYLAKAVFALPPMAQNFKLPAPKQAQEPVARVVVKHEGRLTSVDFEWAESVKNLSEGVYPVYLRPAPKQAQEPEAWVWNPAKESWEQVRAFGHWQQGAIYAFGPNPPAPKQAEPEGYKLVPVKPTQAMCVAAVKFVNGDAVYKNVAAAALEIEEGIYGEAYRAMLAAAPTPPEAA